jgi:hypothetical protein
MKVAFDDIWSSSSIVKPDIRVTTAAEGLPRVTSAPFLHLHMYTATGRRSWRRCYISLGLPSSSLMFLGNMFDSFDATWRRSLIQPCGFAVLHGFFSFCSCCLQVFYEPSTLKQLYLSWHWSDDTSPVIYGCYCIILGYASMTFHCHYVVSSDTVSSITIDYILLPSSFDMTYYWILDIPFVTTFVFVNLTP